MLGAPDLLDDPAATIGFVAGAYRRGALTVDEVRHWAWRAIERTEEADIVRLPHCVFDLTEFDPDVPWDFSRVCEPFGGGTGLTDAEDHAIDGISWRRGLMTKWTIAGRAAAERALKANPHIEVRFRTMFPFVRW